MKKSFLTKLLAITISAGLFFHPVLAYADEPLQGDDPGLVVKELEETEGTSGESGDGNLDQDTDNDLGQNPEQDPDNITSQDPDQDPDYVNSQDTDPDPNAAPAEDPDDLTKDGDDIDGDGASDPDLDDIEEDGETPATPMALGATNGAGENGRQKFEYAYISGDYLYYSELESQNLIYYYVMVDGVQNMILGNYQSPFDLKAFLDKNECESGTYTVRLTSYEYVSGDRIAEYAVLDYQYMKVDPTDLPEIQHMSRIGDIVSWDAFEGASGYNIEVGTLSTIVSATTVNLHDLCDMFADNVLDFGYGNYTVTITAVNSQDNTLSKPFSFDYEYTKADEGIKVLKDVEVSTNSYEFIKYDNTVDRLNLSIPNHPELSIKLIEWQKKDGENWITSSDTTFKHENYRFVFAVSLNDGYGNNYVIDDNFYVTIGLLSYYPTSVETDTYGKKWYYFTSEEYDLTSTSTKEIIQSADVTSNAADIAKYDSPVIGVTVELPNNSKLEASFVKWEKMVGGEWQAYNNKYFEEGTYKFRYSVNIKSEYKDKYEFGDFYTVYDGVPYVNNETTTEHVGNVWISTVFFFDSPEFVITKTSLPVIQNVRIEGDMLYWDVVEGIDYYLLEAGGHNTTVDSGSVNLRNVLDNFVDVYSDMGYGTYKIKLTGMTPQHDILSQTAEIEYKYEKDPLAKEKIEYAEVTSDVADIAGYEKPVSDVTSELPNNPELETGFISWQKKVNGVWEDCSDKYFEHEVYRYKYRVSIKTDYRDKYEFANTFYCVLDGTQYKPVSSGGGTAEEGYAIIDYFFNSPEFDYTESSIGPNPPEDKEISKVEFNTNFSEVFAKNGTIKDLVVTDVDENINMSFSDWQKKTGDSWTVIDGSDFSFTPGTYRVKASIEVMSSEYYFTDDVKLVVNGAEWTVIYISGYNEGHLAEAIFMSPEFEVKDNGSGGGGDNGGGTGGNGGNGGSGSSGGNQSSPSTGQGGSQSQSSGSQGSSSDSSGTYTPEGEIPAGAVTVTTSDYTVYTESEEAGPAVLGADRNIVPDRTLKIKLNMLSDAQYKSIIIDNISATPAGGTLRIEVDHIACFDKQMLDAFAKKGNIDLEIVFPVGRDNYMVVIPAGFDVSKLPDNKGYCGFLRLLAIVGGNKTGVKK